MGDFMCELTYPAEKRDGGAVLTTVTAKLFRSSERVERKILLSVTTHFGFSFLNFMFHLF